MNKEFLQSLREQIKSGTVTEQEPMSRHTRSGRRFCSAGNKGRNQECDFLCQRSRGSFFCYG